MFPLIHGWTDVQPNPEASLYPHLMRVQRFVAGMPHADGLQAVD